MIELVLRPDVREILGHFRSLWGVRTAFCTPDREELCVEESKPECLYCRLLRADLGYEDDCLAQFRAKQDEAAADKKKVVYECHGGLNEVVIPVFNESRLLGFVTMGQFRTEENRIPQSIREEWAKKRGTPALAEAFDRVPLVRSDHVEHILALLSTLARFIVSQHLIEVRQGDILQPLLLYMEQNIERNVSLAEVAAVAHRSPSTLSHLFRKVLGQSFKRVQIKMKMDRAERHLRTDPQVTVREVAYRLGYQDPLYFSRLFKKYQKVSPSSCRSRPSG